MKIYLLALLGLAAGGVVETNSNSSTSDSTVAAPPDFSAPVVASSGTSHTPSSTSPTSSPSSIGSIDSSTSSLNAPAGDDIIDIPVSMTFTAEAIDDEIRSNIKKSVAASVHRALGTHVTMNTIDVVETAPAGRRLASNILVTYTVKVKAHNKAAAKHAIEHDDFKGLVETALETGPNKITVDSVSATASVPLNKVCTEAPTQPATDKGTLTCTNNAVVGNMTACVLDCTTNVPNSPPSVVTKVSNILCQTSTADATKAEWKGSEAGECKISCLATDVSNGARVCTPLQRVEGATSIMCPVKCNADYQLTQQSNHTCTSTGAWAGGVTGTCVEDCPDAAELNAYCWTNSGGKKLVGKCDGAKNGTNRKCKPDQTVSECDASQTTCGDSNVEGECKNDVCEYKEKDPVFVTVSLEFEFTETNATKRADIIAGTNDLFNNQFKSSVVSALDDDVTIINTDVIIKEIKTKTKVTRRLDGKFLQDDSKRMLQVEYSVQVNQTDAAAAKATLDKFMPSSNLT